MTQKKLTSDNFLVPDRANPLQVGLDRSGHESQLSAAEWARQILEVELGPEVPKQVAALFEGAHGLLLYGFFWCPLYAHGVAESFQAADSAVAVKCEIEGAPARAVPTFQTRIAWLFERGVLNEADVTEWESLRHLRNEFAQRSERTLFPALWTLDLLERVARGVNRLYRGSTANPKASP
jgi:hypothetical protein